MPLQSEVTKPVPFRTLSHPEQWTLGDEPAYLAVTEKNWSKYYSSPPGGSDFAAYIYVVASLGMKPSPGYTIKIAQIQQQKERITIRAELGEPDPKKFYAQVIVYPLAVAQIPIGKFEQRGLLRFVFIDQKGRQLATVETEI